MLFSPSRRSRADWLSSITPKSAPPTIKSVGTLTRANASPARSGRPPRETTAPMRSPSTLAATRAAAAPVLAPNKPIGKLPTSGSSIAQRTACVSRRARRSMSKTFLRSSSSAASSRSNNNVAIPRRLNASATRLFLGLNRLDPLPCAKMTIARAPSGRFKVPARPSGGISTSREAMIGWPLFLPSRLAGKTCGIGRSLHFARKTLPLVLETRLDQRQTGAHGSGYVVLMEPLQTLPRPDGQSSGRNTPTLADKVRFLSCPATHSCAPEQVAVRETHMSWVFMAGDRVYKLKKPVRFAYLDFSTLDRRAAACRAEYQLNRRLAPDIYLGVVPLTLSTSGLAIAGDGPVVDWLVVMRRLEENDTLEAALHGGWLKPSQVDRLAATLRAFYAHAPRVLLEPAHYLVAWHDALNANCRVLFNARFGLPHGAVERIAQVQRRFAQERSALLVERIHKRRFVDAHGDLRPEHIWLRDPLTIIDCLEFDAKLRALDPLDEIAFLHLECELSL